MRQSYDIHCRNLLIGLSKCDYTRPCPVFQQFSPGPILLLCQDHIDPRCLKSFNWHELMQSLMCDNFPEEKALPPNFSSENLAVLKSPITTQAPEMKVFVKYTKSCQRRVLSELRLDPYTTGKKSWSPPAFEAFRVICWLDEPHTAKNSSSSISRFSLLVSYYNCCSTPSHVVSILELYGLYVLSLLSLPVPPLKGYAL